MTAPDVNDVRAKFEAWFAKACPTTDAQAREGIIGATTCRNFAFKAWKAAHADLSGEVRELVEADREYDAARTAYESKAPSGVGELDSRTEADYDALCAAETRRSAALAKFHPTQRAGGRSE